MTFVLSFLISLAASASCHDLAPHIQRSVAQNTFKLVPRNAYAATLTEETARSLHEQNCWVKDLTISDKMNCDILKSCTGEHCKLEYAPFGSAFINEKNGQLLTAWHVVFPTHAAGLIFMQGSLSQVPTDELNSRLSVLKPEFILLDSNDNLIFDTQKTPSQYSFWGNPLSTIYQANGHKQNQPYGYFENSPDDFVAINIGSLGVGSNLSSTTLSKGLSITSLTKKDDLAEKCLYSAGYQYHDGKFRISSGKKELVKTMQSYYSFVSSAELDPLPMAVAKILELDNAMILRILGYSENNIEKTLAQFDEKTIRNAIQIVLSNHPRHQRDQSLEDHPAVIFYDAKVLPGQSGGPIVDDAGTVVGITTNAFLDKSIVTDGHYTSHGAVGFFLGSLSLSKLEE